ncbi:unnamed protein product [Gongylonema pulchrum]|uniref:Ig-like domain-containing protein n=1 Tax=Gongylonema pulchrum TaxID=637853 RepID=A0A183DRI7_9BILA|nr:unnamed protein product [Gongylonema pulchrum]
MHFWQGSARPSAEFCSLFLNLLFAISTSSILTPSKHIRCNIIDWSTIPTPPRFIHEPNDPTIYFTLESTQSSDGHNLDYLKERTLRCIADGNPPPGYKWRKNGKPFNLAMFSDRIAQRPGEGSFVFSKLTAADEGVYQCEATNDNGTAISEKITLEQTC